MNYLYLLIDFGCILIPFIFSFHPKIQFHKQWVPFLKANILVLLLFVVWDIYYTQIGVWGFNSDYLIGFNFFGLPIEEILFFFCIPYACIFSYHALNKILTFKINNNTPKLISYLLILFLLIVGVFYIPKLYTSVTFITLSIVLIYLVLSKKYNFLSRFYLMFLFIIPFFIISNGILTGTGINEEVVWYNDQENMQLRILTIPIADTFYGMLLLVLNAYFFELFKKH